jgi:hypothetical protein
MEPDTSRTKMYSLGGMTEGDGRSGGCTISIKKFSVSPLLKVRPELMFSPVSL